jgi:hypothetical protein
MTTSKGKMPLGSRHRSGEGQRPNSLTTFKITGKLGFLSQRRHLGTRQSGCAVETSRGTHLRHQKRFRGKSMQKEKIELNRNRTLPLGGSQYRDEQWKSLTRNTPNRADRHHFGRENLLPPEKLQFANQNTHFRKEYSTPFPFCL